MSKDEFFADLRRRLRRLPPSEMEAALEYYREYLEDAGPENEAAILKEWGSPSRVASQILVEFAAKQMQKKSSVKRGISTVWIVILTIFASPMAIPIAACLVCILLAIAAVVLGILAALGGTALGVMVMGLIFAYVGVSVVPQSLPTAAFYVGCGLFAVGFGVAACLFVVWLSRNGLKGIVFFWKKLLHRRRRA